MASQIAAKEASNARDSLAETNTQGRFVRTAAGYREIVSKDHPIFKPEFDRFHLYISYACPWWAYLLYIHIDKH